MNNVPQATFDYICAALSCPICGQPIDKPCSVDLQTKISSKPAVRELRIGDQIDPIDDPESAGYIRVSDAITPGTLHVIEAWSCPHCGANFLWARLTIKNNILYAVAVTDLSEKSLEHADFITSQVLILVPMESISAVTSLIPKQLRAELSRIAAERKQ
jgi:hypothetical protein